MAKYNFHEVGAISNTWFKHKAHTSTGRFSHCIIVGVPKLFSLDKIGIPSLKSIWVPKLFSHYFGKRSAWSLLYFLNHAYFDIWPRKIILGNLLLLYFWIFSNSHWTKWSYRGFSPYGNFITANFITAIFQNFPKIFGLCLFRADFFINAIFIC